MSLEASVKAKRTDVQVLVNQAKTLYADLEAQGDKATADDRQKLNNLIADGETKRAELVKLEQLLEQDRIVNGGTAQPKAVEDVLSGDAERKAWKSWGQQVAASAQFQSAKQRPMDGKMDRVAIENPRGVKAVYGSLGTAGGALVQNDVQPDVFDIARQQPFSLLDIVNMVQTESDTIEYVVMDARTNNAATVAEYTGGAFGLKPESTMTFNTLNAAVKWIATWVGASKQILMDAPRLRDTIDGELTYMVRRTLEAQILSGDGTGQNFTGILNWSGIQTRTMSASAPVGRGQVTGDTKMTTLRRAITDIRLEFYEATGIVLNPADTEALEVTEYTGNRYANAFDPVTMRIWRVPIIETQAITALTALVGNFTLGCTLWDRMQTEILAGQPNDMFLRNAIALLAELRAAFAVTRPKAFEKITLI